MHPQVRAAGRRLADVLDRAGVIERSRARAVGDLAWPRVVTGFARMSQQAADVAMVGLAVGTDAVTGMAFAFTYWALAAQLGLGIAGGTISLVSQRIGAEDPRAAGTALKQSLWLALGFGVPMALAYYAFARPLVGVFGDDPVVVGAGVTYLTTIAPGVVFSFLNKLGSRTFAGFDDTLTPMFIRAGAAAVNIALNAVFIFGLGMGVAGAALGTTVALGLATLAFGWGLFGGRYPYRGRVPVTIPLGGPHVDAATLRRLVRVAAPLMVRRTVRAAFRFPLLGIVAVFGPVVVAALEIGRRVRNLMNALTWGYSIAASSLVGRHLGAGDVREAEATARDILRLSAVSYVLLAALAIVFARPIARVFVRSPETVAAATTFVRVFALASIGLGMDGSATGVLRGGGDTRWTFYATLIGMYLVALPLAYASVATGIGIVALYAGLVLETAVPALVTVRRYATGVWKEHREQLAGE
ncbi:MAG: MATE family efflux transporter [Haloferacaceae archaeon]